MIPLIIVSISTIAVHRVAIPNVKYPVSVLDLASSQDGWLQVQANILVLINGHLSFEYYKTVNLQVTKQLQLEWMTINHAGFVFM